MRPTTPAHKFIRWTPALEDILARGWRAGTPTDNIIRELEAHPDIGGKRIAAASTVWAKLRHLHKSRPNLKRCNRRENLRPISKKRVVPTTARRANSEERVLCNLDRPQIARLLELLLSQQ